MKTALFLYEASQIGLLPKLLSRVEGEYDVIAAGADIEFLLEKKGVSFVSAKGFLTIEPYQRLLDARILSKKIMDDESLSFFSYQDISLASLYTPALFYYLTYFLYYLDLATSLARQGYGKILFVKRPFIDSPTAGVLTALNSRAVHDAVALAAQDSHIEFEAWKQPEQKSKNLSFSLKRTFFGLLINLLNIAIAVLVPRKKIQILASDYWKNIKTLIEEMPDAELVLLDRAEMAKMGLAAIIRNRVRFVHAEDFINKKGYDIAHEKAALFKKKWSETTNASLENAAFREHSLKSVLDRAMGRFINDSERVVADIIATEAMFGAMKPDVVGVRASISAQTHFAVLCEVARSHNIPSLEVQHGIFSVGRETETRERAAEYIAEYGAHERKLWEEHQYATRSKFIDIGSPRFDEYIPKRDAYVASKKDTFEVLHIAPPWFPGSWNDSWDICTFFATAADAVRDIPNVHVTIKLRASKVGEEFYREAVKRAYGDTPHTIVLFESLADLLPKADLVITCHSTAMLESLLAHRPTILDASLPVYTQLARNDFGAYLQALALEVAETPLELKELIQKLASNKEECMQLSKNAEIFIRENFLLEDGKSSKRLADFIRTLSRGAAL